MAAVDLFDAEAAEVWSTAEVEPEAEVEVAEVEVEDVEVARVAASVLAVAVVLTASCSKLSSLNLAFIGSLSMVCVWRMARVGWW